jgi:hypothetical protein
VMGVQERRRLRLEPVEIDPYQGIPDRLLQAFPVSRPHQTGPIGPTGAVAFPQTHAQYAWPEALKDMHFVHVPKCGGTSVTKVRRLLPPHCALFRASHIAVRAGLTKNGLFPQQRNIGIPRLLQISRVTSRGVSAHRRSRRHPFKPTTCYVLDARSILEWKPRQKRMLCSCCSCPMLPDSRNVRVIRRLGFVALLRSARVP